MTGGTPSGARRGAASELDLNLLKPLQALLTERSVTRAATRLGLTQPAMSAALRRLRAHFGDPLLVRSGGGYRLTPLAEFLRERADDALVAAERALSVPSTFDPRHGTRRFTVVSSEYAMALIGGSLTAGLRDAPDVSVEFRVLTDDINDDPEAVLRTADLVLLPRGHLDGYPSADLWHDRWVCVLTSVAAAGRRTVSAADLATMRWVAVQHGSGTPIAPLARQVEAGFTPHVSLLVQSHLAVPLLLPGSDDLAALVQERLVRLLPANDRLRAFTCPFYTSPIHEAMWWHPTNEDDAAHRWFRTLVSTVTAPLRRAGVR